MKSGKLVGVVSARDLLGENVLLIDETARETLASFRVRENMRSLISAPTTTNIREVAKLMAENNIRHLVVAKGIKPVGVLSLRDVMACVKGFNLYFQIRCL